MFFTWDCFSFGIIFLLGLFFSWDCFLLGNVFLLGLFFTWDCFSLGIVFDQECFFLGLFFPGIVSAGNVFTGIIFAWDCYFGIEKDGNETAGMMCPDTILDCIAVVGDGVHCCRCWCCGATSIPEFRVADVDESPLSLNMGLQMVVCHFFVLDDASINQIQDLVPQFWIGIQVVFAALFNTADL